MRKLCSILLLFMLLGSVASADPPGWLLRHYNGSFDYNDTSTIHGNFVVEGNLMVDGATTNTGDLTLENEEILRNDTDGDVEVIANDLQYNLFDFVLDSSVATSDSMWMNILFRALNSTSNETVYAGIRAVIDDQTTATEDASLATMTVGNDTLASRTVVNSSAFYPYTSGGLTLGSANNGWGNQYFDNDKKIVMPDGASTAPLVWSFSCAGQLLPHISTHFSSTTITNAGNTGSSPVIESLGYFALPVPSRLMGAKVVLEQITVESSDVDANNGTTATLYAYSTSGVPVTLKQKTNITSDDFTVLTADVPLQDNYSLILLLEVDNSDTQADADFYTIRVEARLQ